VIEADQPLRMDYDGKEERMSTSSTKPAADETSKADRNARIGLAQGIAMDLSGALSAGSKAYVSGLVELGKALGTFGREALTETNQHVRATFGAKNLRSVAELQAAFAQRRIEMSATHTKEIADLARAKSEEVIAPIAVLLKQNKAA
jgi:Phasin protein